MLAGLRGACGQRSSTAMLRDAPRCRPRRRHGLHRRAPPRSFPAGQVLPQRLPQPGFSLLFLMAPSAAIRLLPLPASTWPRCRLAAGWAARAGGCAQVGLGCSGWRRGSRAFKPQGQGLAAPRGVALGSAPCPALARQGPRREATSQVPSSQVGLWGTWEPPWPYPGSGVPGAAGLPPRFWGSLPVLGAAPSSGCVLCAHPLQLSPPASPSMGSDGGLLGGDPHLSPVPVGTGTAPRCWEEPQGAPRPCPCSRAPGALQLRCPVAGGGLCSSCLP